MTPKTTGRKTTETQKYINAIWIFFCARSCATFPLYRLKYHLHPYIFQQKLGPMHYRVLKGGGGPRAGGSPWNPPRNNPIIYTIASPKNPYLCQSRPCRSDPCRSPFQRKDHLTRIRRAGHVQGATWREHNLRNSLYGIRLKKKSYHDSGKTCNQFAMIIAYNYINYYMTGASSSFSKHQNRFVSHPSG